MVLAGLKAQPRDHVRVLEGHPVVAVGLVDRRLHRRPLVVAQQADAQAVPQTVDGARQAVGADHRVRDLHRVLPVLEDVLKSEDFAGESLEWNGTASKGMEWEMI